MKKFPITYPGREKAIKQMIRVLAKTHDKFLRSMGIKQSSRIMALDEQALTDEVNKLRRKQYPAQVAKELAEEINRKN